MNKLEEKFNEEIENKKDNNIEDGTEIVQADYVGSEGQKWIFRNTNKNGWVISPLSNPELSITIKDSIQNGAKIILSKTVKESNSAEY